MIPALLLDVPAREPHRCRDCGRPVVRSPLLGGCGPKSARQRGLTAPRRAARHELGQPGPDLLDLIEGDRVNAADVAIAQAVDVLAPYATEPYGDLRLGAERAAAKLVGAAEPVIRADERLKAAGEIAAFIARKGAEIVMSQRAAGDSVYAARERSFGYGRLAAGEEDVWDALGLPRPAEEVTGG